MLLDFKKIHSLCAFNNYTYDESSKNTTIYSLVLSSNFGLKGHKLFEHKINSIYIYIRAVCTESKFRAVTICVVTWVYRTCMVE
jgi:hypothetical protein